MTVEDLELGQIYEVVEEFDSGYGLGLAKVTGGRSRLAVGTLMKYAKHNEDNLTSLAYGFHFIIGGEIVENTFDISGVFWFSEKELS